MMPCETGGDLDRDPVEQACRPDRLSRVTFSRAICSLSASRKWAPTFWCSFGVPFEELEDPAAERLAWRSAFRIRSQSAIG